MERTTFFLRENIRLILGLAVVIFVTILIASFIFRENKSTQVSINKSNFTVTIAKSETEKQIGLSNTKKLNENHGMLFVFEKPAYYSFWMNNMNFPIDIIYIKDDKVTTIISNAPPPSKNGGQLPVYKPNDESDKVLEINAGLAEKYNIKEGSIVKINNL